MTVSTTNTREIKAGNGTTTKFSIGFEFFKATDLEVTKVNTDGTTVLWTLNDEYTISGGGGSTGSLSTTQGNTLASGEKLAIRRITARTQQLDLVANDLLPAEDLEDRYDRTVYVVQEVAEEMSRAAKAPVSDPEDVQLIFPGKDKRKDKVLGFDSSGNPTVLIPEDVLGSTDDLPEGNSNLYYTAERARDDVSAALVAGNNLTKTVDDANDIINLSVDISDTSDLPEGSNLYYTDERAQDAVGTIMAGANTVSVTYDDGAGSITVQGPADTGDLPEGSNLYHTDERAQDAAAAMLSGGTGISTSYDDGNNTLTVSVDGTVAREGIQNVFTATQDISKGTPSLRLFDPNTTNQNVSLEVNQGRFFNIEQINDDASNDQFLLTFDLSQSNPNMNLNTRRIVNLSNPSNAQDAATKDYVDNNAGGGVSIVEQTPQSWPGLIAIFSWSHGQGKKPAHAELKAKNTSSEHGYDPGELADLVWFDGSGNQVRPALKLTSSTVEWAIGDKTPAVVDHVASSGADARTISTSNWEFFFVAWFT